MSEISTDSTVEEDDEERKDRGPRRIVKRLKTLFCCFRRDESRSKEIVEYDPDDSDKYDYIVEKLVVKRVPLALFAIPVDLSRSADRRRPGDADDISQSSSLSTFGGNHSVANVITRGKCLSSSTRIDRTVYDSSMNKALRSDTNRSFNCQTKVRKQGILSRFGARHSELREFERPSKNPSNFSRSKQSFTEDISMASSTRTDISSRTSTSSIVVQDDVSTQENSCRESAFENERNDKSRMKREDDLRQPNPSIKKDQDDKFGLGRNRRYIVSPFRVRRGSLDLTKPKNVVENFNINGKSLAYIQESLEEKSSESAEVLKDRDLQSNPAVRWRITIKRRCANADSKSRSVEEEMHR